MSDSNSKLTRGWKRCQSVPTDQTGAVSIKINPEKVRGRMIMLVHSGHQGIVKTKRFLRDSVWCPGIDRMVEESVKMPAVHKLRTMI